MKILMILVMFFAVGALLIISNNNLFLYKPENVSKFKSLYFNWIDGIYNNFELAYKDLISMKWFPEK